MAVAIKERPSAELPPFTTLTNPPVTSYWTAIFNYIRFIFQRQDRVITSVSDDGGFMQLNLSSPPPSYSGTVEVFFSKLNGTIQGVATVISTSGSHVTIDYPYSSSFSGFVNFPGVIKDWRVEVIIDKWNGSAYVPINGQLDTSTNPIAKFQALPNGDVIAQVEEYLKPEVSNEFTYNDSSLNFTDGFNSVQYRVRYRENYFGASVGDYLVLSDNDAEPIDFFATNSALQLKATIAPNMGCYLMLDNTDYRSKFLSGFAEPTYWLGLPFDLSLIQGEEVTAIQLWYDANRVQVDSTALGTLVDNIGKISRIGVNRGTVTSNPYSFIGLQLRESLFPFGAVSELKIIRVKEACSGLMLTWKNQLGGWDYWNFDQRSLNNMTVVNGAVFEPYTDMDADSNEIILTKDAGESIQLAASNLDLNDVNGLKGLLKSIAVYAIDSTGAVLYRANVLPGTWNVYDGKKSLYELSFTIVKPSEYIQ